MSSRWHKPQTAERLDQHAGYLAALSLFLSETARRSAGAEPAGAVPAARIRHHPAPAARPAKFTPRADSLTSIQ